MDKITKFERPECKAIGEEIEKALVDLGKRLGVKFSSAGGSIGFTDFTAKIRVEIDDPEAAEAIEREVWNKHCELFGLRPDDFGTVVIAGGESYRVCGFALNRSAKPIKVERVRDGNSMLARDSWVAMIRKATDARLAA